MAPNTPTALLPRHLGIIMDGNGRWANARGLPRVAGHREGAKTVDRIVTECRTRGISVLTLFAFSSQNWSRPTLEIQALMSLLGEYVKRERPKIMENDIRLTAIGDIDTLPSGTRNALKDLIRDSAGNKGLTLALALSYGGREEIIDAAQNLAQRVAAGEISAKDITVELFDKSTWSGSLGPVDLIIRTSGELRVSNFLLWSGAYCELFFTDKMWPEFTEDDLEQAFASFANRNRRFGDIKKGTK